MRDSHCTTTVNWSLTLVVLRPYHDSLGIYFFNWNSQLFNAVRELTSKRFIDLKSTEVNEE
jgi:hypothetical protein